MHTTMNRLVMLSTFVGGGLLATGCDFALAGSISPKATFTADPAVDTSQISAGQNVNVTLTAENVYLIDPSETPPAEHVDDAGHFQIYLDDLDSTPLLITAEVSVTIVVPATIAAGDHKLKCRVHKHDGTPTTAVEEINITVVVTVGGEGEGE